VSDKGSGDVANITPELIKIIDEARDLARRYYKLTGRPLGMTGEIGEVEAARLLGLELEPVRTAGLDARDPRTGRQYQIKTRAWGADGQGKSQRLGTIKSTHIFDAVLLVLMDDTYRPTEIWEAERSAVLAALERPGSKARNQRGQLAVSGFRRIGRRVWPAA
jgi:hypothetical protein